MYCQKHAAVKAADVANISDALVQPTAASNGFMSLMSRITERHRTCESLITKDSHAELKLYLDEPLLIIDERASSEHQAELILKWWEV